jgi:hypothetical protein
MNFLSSQNFTFSSGTMCSDLYKLRSFSLVTGLLVVERWDPFRNHIPLSSQKTSSN